MGTPTRSRLGSASRFGTSDRPATSTGLLNRPSSSSSFRPPTTMNARSSLAHDAIAERPSRIRPNTASNAHPTTTTSRPMSATKTRLMGQYASLGKLAMATPRGGKENVGSNKPGSARGKQPTTPRDLYDYNGRRIDPNGPRKAFTPRSTNRPNRRAFDEDDEDEDDDARYEGRRPATARRDEGQRDPRDKPSARPKTSSRSTARPSTATPRVVYDGNGRRVTRDGRLARDLEWRDDEGGPGTSSGATVLRKTRWGGFSVEEGPKLSSRPGTAVNRTRPNTSSGSRTARSSAGIHHRPAFDTGPGGLGIDHRDPRRRASKEGEKPKKKKSTAGSRPATARAATTRPSTAASNSGRRYEEDDGAMDPRARIMAAADVEELRAAAEREADEEIQPFRSRLRGPTSARSRVRTPSSSRGYDAVDPQRGRDLPTWQQQVAGVRASQEFGGGYRSAAPSAPSSPVGGRQQKQTTHTMPGRVVAPEELVADVTRAIPSVVNPPGSAYFDRSSRPQSAAPSPARPMTSHGAPGYRTRRIDPSSQFYPTAQSVHSVPGTPGGYGIGLDAAHVNYLQQMQHSQHMQQQMQQQMQMQQMQQPQQPQYHQGYHQPGYQHHTQTHAQQQFHQPVTANDDFQATLARAQALAYAPSPSKLAASYGGVGHHQPSGYASQGASPALGGYAVPTNQYEYRNPNYQNLPHQQYVQQASSPGAFYPGGAYGVGGAATGGAAAAFQRYGGAF